MNTPARPPRVRVALVTFVLLSAFIILIVQLVRWQLLDRKRVLPPPASAAATPARGPERGTILDHTGEPLAIDVYQWEIWVQPALVKPERVDKLVADLTQALGSDMLLAPEQLRQAITSRERPIITLARNAPEATAAQIRAWPTADRRGVGMVAKPRRYYPQRSLAAHVLGFVNDEPNAYYGVEQQYSNYLLRADVAFQQSISSIKESYGNLPESWQRYLPSAVGQDLVLTIDRRIQFVAEQVLANALGRYAAEAGTIIVIEPDTGAILAMASLPAYDPNRYATSDEALLVDPAISKQYEPGSVFKVITMAAGIDAGLITPDTVITDTSVLEYGDQIIQNWDKTGLGPITITETLRRSRNIPTAQVAIQMGESLFYQYVRRFGFGELTEVDLANESPGTVKVPGNSLWSQSDLATNSFGQGLAVTPLQVATAISVIANGGMLMRPHVAEALVYQGQVLKPGSTVVRRVIKPETATTMRDMMVDVVSQGTRTARVDGYTVAGKTGTAQIAIEGGYHLTQTIHSFVGFVPAENPRFVALVKLDKPRAFAWAESTAAPSFAELASRVLYLLNVPPAPAATRP